MKTAKSITKQYFLKLLFLLFLLPVFCLAQIGEVHKTVIKTGQDLDYITKAYTYRRNIADSLKADKVAAVKLLKDIWIQDTITNSPGNILTYREHILIDFYTGSYEELLMTNFSFNYFMKSTRDDDWALSLECGDLTLSFLDFWKSKTNEITNRIDSSKLAPVEKEFLITYYKCIVLYIASEDTLASEINALAKAFVKKYPDSKYADFFNTRLANLRKVYYKNFWTVDLNFGVPYLTGDISSHLDGNFAFTGDLEIEIRKWTYALVVPYSHYYVKDSIYGLKNNLVTKLDSVYSSGVGFRLGRTFWDSPHFRMKALAGVDFLDLITTLYNPDGTDNGTVSSNLYGKLYLGLEGFIIMMNLDLRTSHQMYISRQEKDKDFTPFYLKFKVGYNPSVFKQASGLNGDALFATLGVGIGFGRIKAIYKNNLTAE